MEKINDNINISTGQSPEFSRTEMDRMEALSKASKYWIDAYDFVHAYRRNATPWEMMTKRQRMWLWKIKDDIGNVVKQECQSCHAEDLT